MGSLPTDLRRSRSLRWTVEVAGWRHVRRWIVGVRRGEWWIGVRHDFARDGWEINVLGLTALIPGDHVARCGRSTR